MAHIELDVPSLSVNVEDEINQTRVILRQPALIINQSQIPIYEFAENALFAISASFSQTASYALNAGGDTPEEIASLISGTIIIPLQVTSSFAGDASNLYNVNATTIGGVFPSSFATTGSNVFDGDQTIGGIVQIEGDFGVTGSAEFQDTIIANNSINVNVINPLDGSDTITITSPNLNADNLTVNSLFITGSVSGDVFDRFATTSSNAFNGSQTISGSVYIDTTDSDNRIYFSNSGDTITYVGTTMGSISITDGAGYIQLDANNISNNNYISFILNANNDDSILSFSDNTVGRVGAALNFSSSGSLNLYTNDNTATLLINGVAYDDHLLPIATFNNLTGSFATTGSNTFVGDQNIEGSVSVTQGITGSLSGTATSASYASYAVSASYIDGGYY